MAKTKAAAQSETNSQTPVGGLPQFFTKPAVIGKDSHKHAGLRANTGFGFARNSITIPITAMEVVEAAREYPLVFLGDKPNTLAAVTGLRDTNVFINENGRWDTYSYVPLGVRKYPFTLAAVKEETFALCVDEAAEHYMSESPDLPFFEEEGLSPVSSQALEMCKIYRAQMDATRQFCEDVFASGMLEAKTASIKTADNKDVTLDGFMAINENTFRQLSPKMRQGFEQKNQIGLIYLIMASQCNWKYLAMRTGA